MDKIQKQPNTPDPKADAETPSGSHTNITIDPSLERLRSENLELQNTLRMRDARDELQRSLTAAGARSPELLTAAAAGELQLDDDSRVQNTAALVAHLKSKYPAQFGFQRPDASIDGAAGTLSAGSMLTAESLSKMTPAEIQKLDWDDVRRVISKR